MVTGEPPSTLDGGQCKVTVDFEAEVRVKLEGGAGGTPLFRLTVNGKRYMYVFSYKDLGSLIGILDCGYSTVREFSNFS